MNEKYELDVTAEEKLQLMTLQDANVSDWVEWLDYNPKFKRHLKMYRKDGRTVYGLSVRLRYSIGLL